MCGMVESSVTTSCGPGEPRSRASSSKSMGEGTRAPPSLLPTLLGESTIESPREELERVRIGGPGFDASSMRSPPCWWVGRRTAGVPPLDLIVCAPPPCPPEGGGGGGGGGRGDGANKGAPSIGGPPLSATAVEEPAGEAVRVEAVKGGTMPTQGHRASHGPIQPTQVDPVAGPHSAGAVGQPAESRSIETRDGHRGGAQWLPCQRYIY